LQKGAAAVDPEKKESEHVGLYIFHVYSICFSLLELFLVCGIEELSVAAYDISVEGERLSLFTFADYEGDEALWVTRRR
jgi:hypothetical protein